MAHVEMSIDVNAPVRVAYNQWTQFEEFPRFMEGVKEVKQIDAKSLRWRANVGGKDLEWTAEITEQVPDTRIAWRSTSGAPNSGAVTFHPLIHDGVRVTLRIEYDPEGALETAGSALGVVGTRIERDLARFKDFIEKRGNATGAWRGEIHHGNVQASAPSSQAGRAMGAAAAAGGKTHEGPVVPGATPIKTPGGDLGSGPLTGKTFTGFPP